MRIVTYGRSSANDRVIADNQASRTHCQIIQHSDGRFEIIDLGSTNGTYVNGRPIRGKAPLQPYDVVRIGQTTLRWRDDFSYTPPSTSPYTPPTCPDSSEDGKASPAPKASASTTGIAVLILGILAFGFILYIIISYFSNGWTQLFGHFGGAANYIKLFPLYLHGTVFTSGQWFPMIAAMVLGGMAALLNAKSDFDDESTANIIGTWLANAAISVGTIFLLIAIFAPQIVQLY